MSLGDEIDGIEEVDPITGVTTAPFEAYKIYPANLFMTTKEATLRAIHEIEDDLTKQVAFFESIGKEYEAKRLYERVTYDMEMIRELGTVPALRIIPVISMVALPAPVLIAFSISSRMTFCWLLTKVM